MEVFYCETKEELKLWDVVQIGLRHNLPVHDPFATVKEVAKRMNQNVRLVYRNYYCPIKPLYTAISSLNPAEIGMISSYFKFQAPH